MSPRSYYSWVIAKNPLQVAYEPVADLNVRLRLHNQFINKN